jgi:hypothetical protein
MMEIRNPVFTAANAIDCEINHPIHGWIPFTAVSDDVEQLGQEVYAAALAMNPQPYQPPAPYVPTREQQEAARQAAYTAEADPIAMQMLRDEATKEEWLAKIEEIKARYPYLEETAQ